MLVAQMAVRASHRAQVNYINARGGNRLPGQEF